MAGMAEIGELTHFAGCGSRYGAKDTASKEILGLPGNPQNTYQNNEYNTNTPRGVDRKGTGRT